MAVKRVYLSEAGAAAEAYAKVNNIALNFARFGIGDGENATPENCEVKNERYTLPIQMIKDLGDGVFKIRGSFDNSGLTEDFEYREIALYITDPKNTDNEILYCYGNAKTAEGDYTETIPAFTSSGNKISRLFDIDVRVSGGSATFTIDDTAKADIATTAELREDLSQEIEERKNAIIDIAHGGTGATTDREAQYNLLNNLEEMKNQVTDDFEGVGRFITARNKTNGAVYKFKVLLLWNYIKEKIASVLGLTAEQYNGNAKTATTLKGAQLAEGVDLNSVLTPGEYYALDNKEYTNAPCKNFSLRVIQMMSSYKYQILYAYQTAKVYCRCYYFTGSEHTWTEWKELATTQSTVAAATKATQDGNGNNIVNTYATKSEVSKVESDAWGITKGKISSELGLTATAYNGKAATAGTADTAKACSGNAATATKADSDSDGRQICTTYIKSLSVSGNEITFTRGNGTVGGKITTQDAVYTCSTAAGTAAKTIAATGFTLTTGAYIRVVFTNGNSIARPTLNVNSTGAKEIVIPNIIDGSIRTLSTQYGSSSTGAFKWKNNTVLELYYNGSYWVVMNNPIIYSNRATVIGSANEVCRSATVHINGYKVQNGIYNGNKTSGSTESVTYDIPFTDNNYYTLTIDTAERTTTNKLVLNFANIQSKTLTGFTGCAIVSNLNGDTAEKSAGTYNWHAQGY